MPVLKKAFVVVWDKVSLFGLIRISKVIMVCSSQDVAERYVSGASSMRLRVLEFDVDQLELFL